MEIRCAVGPGAALPARTSGPAEDLRPRPRRHTVPANEILVRLTFNPWREHVFFVFLLFFLFLLSSLFFAPCVIVATATIICSMTRSDLHRERYTCVCVYARAHV